MCRVIALGVFCVALAMPCFGQDSFESTESAEVKELPGSLSGAAESEQRDWKPQLQVVLFTKPGGRGVSVPKNIHTTVMRSENRAVVRGGRTVSVPVLVPFRTTRAITVMEPGTAVMYCDAFESSISGKNEELNIDFKCDRLSLRLGHVSLTADSAASEDGQLVLQNASIVQAGTAFTADRLTLKLPLFGIKATPHNQPVPPPEQPIPESLTPEPHAVWPESGHPTYKEAQEDPGFKRDSVDGFDLPAEDPVDSDEELFRRS